MTPAESLRARYDALDGRLGDADRALSHSATAERLEPSVGRLLLAEIASKRQIGAGKRESIVDVVASDKDWDAVATLERESTVVLAEALAALQRAYARLAGFDDVLCVLADRLLLELEEDCRLGWNRCTALDANDSFSEVVQIVRIRFPTAGIWDLPIAAHEFGHYVAYRETSRVGGGTERLNAVSEHISKRLFGSADKAWVRPHQYELFADCFATFTLGPSYPLSAMLLRFNPRSADTDTHPSTARRFVAMTSMLRFMNEASETKDAFNRVLETLEAFWSGALGAADAAKRETDARTNGAENDARCFHAILTTALPTARYKGWADARELARAIENAHAGPPPYSLRDLLNSAWMVRGKRTMTPHEISSRIVTLVLEQQKRAGRDL